MIQLFLDGHLVIPTDNSSIKLTVENSYFTKSTSYTYDVELPLAIDENRELFGFINRIDVEKETKIFDARLIVDNVCVLAGTAHITSISETAVKVQLLGSAASYNYGNKMDGLYIDELEMGDWYMTTWPDGSHWVTDELFLNGHWEYYPKDTHFKGLNTKVFYRATFFPDKNWPDSWNIDKLYSGEYPWCAFPTINANADTLCNGYHFRFVRLNSKDLTPILKDIVIDDEMANALDNTVVVSAIQPFVWIMAQKVAEATGFKLEKQDNALWTNEFFRKIFIVNTNNLIECNKCLPHWTVNEWWTQVENTFGVVVHIDYVSRKISLLQRRDHYEKGAETVYLSEIVDEFTADVDDDTQSDISVNNVGFADFDCERYELLSEFIRNSAEINNDFDDIDALNAWATKQGTEIMKTKKSVIFKCRDGRHFIYSETDGIVEVDMYRPRIVKDDREDLDIELKFVPARYAVSECCIFRAPGSANLPDEPIGSFPVYVLQAPGISKMNFYKKFASNLDIEAVINEEQEEGTGTDDKPNLIYIAIFNKSKDLYNVNLTLSTGETVNDQLPYPRPLLRERLTAKLGAAAINPDAPQSDSLSLIPIEGQINLAANTIVNSVRIDTTVRHCIRFISDRVPDPGDVFIIRNRRFVCEKIEVDIASTGLRKLMTGYFYEYN